MNSSASSVGLGTWTVLGTRTDGVRAVVSRDQDGYAVRDGGGRMLGRYTTARQALDSLALDVLASDGLAPDGLAPDGLA